MDHLQIPKDYTHLDVFYFTGSFGAVPLTRPKQGP